MTTARVRAEGKLVLLDIAGVVKAIPWQAAEQLGLALRDAAKRAEEQDQALAIAADQAVLLRAGVPLGLTNDPRIQQEAVSQALYDPNLRRYLPGAGGIPSSGVVGRPSLRQGRPRLLPTPAKE